MSENINTQGMRTADSAVKVLFQPVLDLDGGRVFGFEAQAELHHVTHIDGSTSFLDLLTENQQLMAWQGEYHQEAIRVLSDQSNDKHLLIPVTSESLLDHEALVRGLMDWCQEFNLSAGRLILLLTPPAATSTSFLREIMASLTASPFRVALSCAGAQLPMLASEAILAGADFLRLDRSVVRNIDSDSLTQDSVAALVELAAPRGVRVLAERVETYLEFDTLHRLGVTLLQGDFVSEPQHLVVEDFELKTVIADKFQRKGCSDRRRLGELSLQSDALSPSQTIEVALEKWAQAGGILPVVQDKQLLGVIRESFVMRQIINQSLDRDAPVSHCMEPVGQTLSAESTVADLANLVREGRIGAAGDAFPVLKANKEFAGMLATDVIVRALADIHHEKTNQVNPLTGLPGRVVIDESVDRLLQRDALFVVALITINDLDAYNDKYGHVEGDRVIQQVGSVLSHECDRRQDFVAHLNGGRFGVVFRSEDWFERCERIVAIIDRISRGFYGTEDQLRGSVCNVDRLGRSSFSPFFSLAIGAVPVFPGKFDTYQEVFSTAAEVQLRASGTYGGAIYVDQRKYRSATGRLTVRLS